MCGHRFGGVGLSTCGANYKRSGRCAGRRGDNPTTLSLRETECSFLALLLLRKRDVWTLHASVTGVVPNGSFTCWHAWSAAYCEAIAAGDQKSLSQAPGVGPKCAANDFGMKSKTEEWQIRRVRRRHQPADASRDEARPNS